ncbi:hypothetical protein CK203_004581 [Vitis vinifera]|uniref:Reverse transcriptase zinc-binding domain-containing protein n=1 Tax=Vitis vinifera TaxID=29760 RepID=A0A438KGL4_VITVI|nr:hypothetical protein CK203_004581 [Vitis vinifera]
MGWIMLNRCIMWEDDELSIDHILLHSLRQVLYGGCRFLCLGSCLGKDFNVRSTQKDGMDNVEQMYMCKDDEESIDCIILHCRKAMKETEKGLGSCRFLCLGSCLGVVFYC